MSPTQLNSAPHSFHATRWRATTGRVRVREAWAMVYILRSDGTVPFIDVFGVTRAYGPNFLIELRSRSIQAPERVLHDRVARKSHRFKSVAEGATRSQATAGRVRVLGAWAAVHPAR